MARGLWSGALVNRAEFARTGQCALRRANSALDGEKPSSN